MSWCVLRVRAAPHCSSRSSSSSGFPTVGGGGWCLERIIRSPFAGEAAPARPGTYLWIPNRPHPVVVVVGGKEGTRTEGEEEIVRFRH